MKLRPAPACWQNPDLSPLGDQTPPPPFPTALLGSLWPDWAAAVASGANAPIDYVAASLLTAAAALIGNARVVRAGSWVEPCVIWTVLVGLPSSGKSPAMDPFISLLEEFQRDLVHGGRILLDDATAKGAAEVSPKGLLLTGDELAGWWTGFSRHGGETFWLKSNGARPHTIHRANSPAINIARLAISVLGGTQPDMIRAIVDAKANGGFPSRLLFIFPAARTGFRLVERANHALAHQALQRLDDLTVEATPVECLLADSAIPVMEAWVEEKLRRSGSEEGVWAEWLGKQGGVALRLALILEHLWWAGDAPHADPAPLEISERAYRAAIRLIDDYFAPMAARTMNVAGRAPEDRAAMRLARLLHRHNVERFNAREVRRNGLGPVGDLAKPAVMTGACEALEAAFLIRHVGIRAHATKGRAAADYEVNPALLAANNGEAR